MWFFFCFVQFKVREDEDLLLLDNSDSDLWRVRTARGEEGMLPSVAVLIPGPFKDAVDAATRYNVIICSKFASINIGWGTHRPVSRNCYVQESFAIASLLIICIGSMRKT